jgi:hypothetical protein
MPLSTEWIFSFIHRQEARPHAAIERSGVHGREESRAAIEGVRGCTATPMFLARTALAVNPSSNPTLGTTYC